MPATYAHIIITDEALSRFRTEASLDQVLRGMTLKYSHFVHLGCVSPDYPYLDFKQPRQKLWADHMHYDHTGDILLTMVQGLSGLRAAGTDRPELSILFSWILGYLSHVTADLVVHPVVRNLVGDYVGHEAAHRECEMIQDVYIYHRVRNGAETRHSELLGLLRNCAVPADPERVHPGLQALWASALHNQSGTREIEESTSCQPRGMI